MVDTTNDFERNFMSQVKGEAPAGGTPMPVAPPQAKPPINKKIFIIIGLAVVVVVGFVALQIVAANTPAPAQYDISGHWGCTDGTEIIFSPDDDTYSWIMLGEHTSSNETGTYAQEGITLTITPISLQIDDKSQNPDRQPISYEVLRSEDTLYLTDTSNQVTQECIRTQDE